jgi:hypothetical protein
MEQTTAPAQATEAHERADGAPDRHVTTAILPAKET